MSSSKQNDRVAGTNPAKSLMQIRRRHQRFLVFGAPLYRTLGLTALALTLTVYLFLTEDDGIWAKTSAFILLAWSYSLAAWVIQSWFYKRYRNPTLYLLLMTADIGIYLYAIYLTGGNRSWMIIILLGRVADQSYLGYKRSLAYSHLVTLGYGLLLFYLAHYEGRNIAWRLESVKLFVLYGMSLYIALTAIPAQGIRSRMKVALRSGQALLEALREKSQKFLVEKEKAEEQSRIKSRFLANMSHEIRTPVNGILGMYQLLQGTEVNPDQQEYLENLRFSAESLLGIIDDILDYSTLTEGRLRMRSRPFSLRDTLESVLESFALKAYEKGLELWFFWDLRIPAILAGDPLRIRQIFINLLGNAVKFTAKGKIELRCFVLTGAELVKADVAGPLTFLWRSIASEQRARLISMTNDPDRLVVLTLVQDTGLGIPADKMETIFQRFSQVDDSNTRQFGGTGLGLAITKELVELMGGAVGVVSSPGLGSTFWLAIPQGRTRSDNGDRRGEGSPLPSRGPSHLILDLSGDSDNSLLRFVEGNGPRVQSVAHPGEISRLDIDGKATLLFLNFSHLEQLTQGLLDDLRSVGFSPDRIVAVVPPTHPTSWNDLLTDTGISHVLKRPIKIQPLLQLLRNSNDGVLVRGTPEEANEAPTLKETVFRGLDVLIAEDNRVNQMVLERLLKGRGAHTYKVANGLEVLQILEKRSFDLILMDVHMPAMDGIEACKKIRMKEKDSETRIPIVAITASVMAEERHHIMNVGMDGFLAKPFKLEALAQELVRLGFGRRREPDVDG